MLPTSLPARLLPAPRAPCRPSAPSALVAGPAGNNSCSGVLSGVPQEEKESPALSLWVLWLPFPAFQGPCRLCWCSVKAAAAAICSVMKQGAPMAPRGLVYSTNLPSTHFFAKNFNTKLNCEVAY